MTKSKTGPRVRQGWKNLVFLEKAFSFLKGF